MEIGPTASSGGRLRREGCPGCAKTGAMSDYRPVRYAPARPAPAVAAAASQEFLRRMSSRRSVRTFSPDPVPVELVRAAVATAATAPSGAHQQPWTFVHVTGTGVRAAIREAAEAEERRAYQGRLGEEWLGALRPLGTDWRKPHLTDAPHLLVVFAQAYGLDTAGARRKHYYVAESVGIACGLLLASLHLAGLAALTHTPSPMRFLTEILDRPRNERPFVVVPIGWPADDCVVPDLRRRPLDEVLVTV